MTIPISCPHCGAKGNAPDNFLNQQVRCSKCKKPFQVTSAAVQAPSPMPPDQPAPDEEKIEEVEEIEEIEEIQEIEEIEEVEEGKGKGKKMARRRNDDDDYDEDDEDSEDRPISIKKKPKKRRSGPSPFADFLLFRRMISPGVIIVIFILGTLTVIGLGIISITLAFLNEPRWQGKLFGTLMGLGFMVVGPFGVRLCTEAIMVVFRINENLTEIKNLLEEEYR